MPVLPLVGSTMMERPGVILPSRSAASIMARAMRSLTEPPGFSCSHLAHTVAAPSASPPRLCRRTMGVPPIRSRTLAEASRSLVTVHSYEVHRLLRGAPLDQVAQRDLVEACGHLARQVAPEGAVHLVGFAVDRKQLLDRALQGPHDVAEPNRFGSAGQVIATPWTSPRVHQARAFELLKNLLEIALRDVLAPGDIL